MSLRQGDTVTLASNPTIELAKYTFIKPSASVQRTIGPDEDPDEVLAEMEGELRTLLARSVNIELGAMNDLLEAYSEGGTDGLADYCNKLIGANDGSQKPSNQENRTQKSGGKKVSGKKASARKRGQKAS